MQRSLDSLAGMATSAFGAGLLLLCGKPPLPKPFWNISLTFYLWWGASEK